MKIDAAFCWDFTLEGVECDCCHFEPAVAYIELYPEYPSGKDVTFYLCEKTAERFAALEKRVAPEEATTR